MDDDRCNPENSDRDMQTALHPSRACESELNWAIFCSAVRSYKKESLVKPFPPDYKDSDGHKNFEELAKTISRIPPLRHPDIQKIGQKEKQLVCWVLNRKDFKLMPVDSVKDAFEKLKTLAGDSTKPPCPNFLFKVIYPENADQRFQTLRGDKAIIHGYHGSHLPNFYSIMHHGLVSNLNKTSAFGEGTYLSHELNVSLNWSPLSVPGAEVGLGKRLSCVAFCEVIDDPSGVKHGADSGTVCAARKDAVPEKYLIVQNDALVRVKYLLVYAEKHVSRPKTELGTWVAHWLRDHRYWILMLAYFLLLMMVGLANSKDFHSYIRRFSHYYLTDYHRPDYDT